MTITLNIIQRMANTELLMARYQNKHQKSIIKTKISNTFLPNKYWNTIFPYSQSFNNSYQVLNNCCLLYFLPAYSVYRKMNGKNNNNAGVLGWNQKHEDEQKRTRLLRERRVDQSHLLLCDPCTFLRGLTKEMSWAFSSWKWLPDSPWEEFLWNQVEFQEMTGGVLSCKDVSWLNVEIFSGRSQQACPWEILRDSRVTPDPPPFTVGKWTS